MTMSSASSGERAERPFDRTSFSSTPYISACLRAAAKGPGFMSQAMALGAAPVFISQMGR